MYLTSNVLHRATAAVYIDVDPNSDRTVLQISTTQGTTQTTALARDWKIKIQQIECNSTTRGESPRDRPARFTTDGVFWNGCYMRAIYPGTDSATCGVVCQSSLTCESPWSLWSDIFVSPTAPSACLQYYTGVSGTIKSFNFDGSEIGPHLASQSYSICIRDEALYCSIEYVAS